MIISRRYTPKKQVNEYDLNKWFAWYPVEVIDGDKRYYVWLQWVQRSAWGYQEHRFVVGLKKYHYFYYLFNKTS